MLRQQNVAERRAVSIEELSACFSLSAFHDGVLYGVEHTDEGKTSLVSYDGTGQLYRRGFLESSYLSDGRYAFVDDRLYTTVCYRQLDGAEHQFEACLYFYGADGTFDQVVLGETDSLFLFLRQAEDLLLYETVDGSKEEWKYHISAWQPDTGESSRIVSFCCNGETREGRQLLNYTYSPEKGICAYLQQKDGDRVCYLLEIYDLNGQLLSSCDLSDLTRPVQEYAIQNFEMVGNIAYFGNVSDESVILNIEEATQLLAGLPSQDEHVYFCMGINTQDASVIGLTDYLTGELILVDGLSMEIARYSLADYGVRGTMPFLYLDDSGSDGILTVHGIDGRIQFYYLQTDGIVLEELHPLRISDLSICQAE